MNQHHDNEHLENQLPEAIEPCWAKAAAPLVALAVLAYLYCAYQHLVM